MINEKLLAKLQAHEYTIKSVGGKNQVYKTSTSGRLTKKVGKIYDNGSGVFFHSNNVAPFIEGKNSFAQIFGNDALAPATVFVKPETKQVSYLFSNKEYTDNTQLEHTLSTYLTKLKGKPLTNLHNIRGAKNDYNNKQRNYLSNQVIYPYFNYAGDFTSAKIIGYDHKAKRTKFANWFHAYKPIKEALNLLDKTVSKPESGYFGEHLLKGNDKKVVIVEGEKTAVILQEIFGDITNIIFIATGGCGGLKSIKTECLNGRDVYIYPDKGVKEWFDFASKKGWNCNYILENSEDVLDGDDVADYINKPLWTDIIESFEVINTGIASCKTKSLQYGLKPKQKLEACIPNWYDLNLRGYEDDCEVENPSMKNFAGNYFEFYEREFESLTANINFNGWVGYGAELRPPNEDDFIYRLEKAFRVAKHINFAAETITYVKTVKECFEHVLYHLKANSNFVFSIDYILNELVPEWDAGDNYIEEYISKKRNWRVITGNIPNNKFETYLAEDRRRYTTNKYLKLISNKVENGHYVSAKEDLDMRKQDNAFIWNLILKYNKEVVGCTTKNQWRTSLKIQGIYIDALGKNTNRVQNVLTPYKVSYIGLANNVTYIKPISMYKVLKDHKIPKLAIKRYNTFKPNKKIANNIRTIVNYLLENPCDLKFERYKRLIIVKPLYTISQMKERLKNDLIKENHLNEMQINIAPAKDNLMMPKVAFDYDLVLDGGIYSCSESEALERGREFIFSWLCYKYKLTGLDAADCWANPEAYLSA